MLPRSLTAGRLLHTLSVDPCKSIRQPYRLLTAFTNRPNADYSAPDVYLPADSRVASVAIIGAPNVGKSSLSNALIGNRVSAVSRKVNTTRSRVMGACTVANRQLILLDTPGVVERLFVKSLGADRRELTTAGWGSAADADVVLSVVDVSRHEKHWQRCARICSELIQIRRAVQDSEQLHAESRCDSEQPSLILVLNKCDKVRPKTLLLEAAEFFKERIEGFDSCFDQRIFMVSAYNGRGVSDLRESLLTRAVPGSFEVPEGTTHCDDDLELVRQHLWEKLLHRVHEEVPYRCRFENDACFEMPNGDLYVSEVIRVPSAGALAIVVGSRGQNIQWIREKTMESASDSLKRKVHLKLRVVVR